MRARKAVAAAAMIVVGLLASPVGPAYGDDGEVGPSFTAYQDSTYEELAGTAASLVDGEVDPNGPSLVSIFELYAADSGPIDGEGGPAEAQAELLGELTDVADDTTIGEIDSLYEIGQRATGRRVVFKITIFGRVLTFDCVNTGGSNWTCTIRG